MSLTRSRSSESLLSLSRLLRHLKPSRTSLSSSSSRSSSGSSPTFAHLPPELLVHIASFLPPSSAGEFSLCNKALYTLLSIPYLKFRRGHPAVAPAELLKLLEPDLPNHIVCYHCGKLHGIKRPAQHIQPDKRCDIVASESMRTYIHPRFSYVIFQMAMKRHRQGRSPHSLLQLLSYADSDSTNAIRTSSSCRVVDGSLLFRQQHIFIVHAHNEGTFRSDMKTTICPHAQELHGESDYGRRGREKNTMVYTPGSVDVDRAPPTAAHCDSCDYKGAARDEGNWSGLIRCRQCATEFRIDTLAVGKEGTAFVVTRWKDLGEGRGADDPVWRAHLDRKGAGVRREKVGGRSICERFEGEGWTGGLESLVSPKEMKRVMNFRYFGQEI